MNPKKLVIGLVACTAFLAFEGCAFTPQTANIAPTVDVVSSSEGKGIIVALSVTDERPSKSLGHRGAGFSNGAEIKEAQDLPAIVQKEVTDGLRKKGFLVVDGSGSSNAKLVVEIRLLDYSTSVGFWTGGVDLKGALKAVANKNGKTYEKMYRYDKEERIVFVPGADTNEKWINAALSNVLTQLLDDNGLTMFLTQTGS